MPSSVATHRAKKQNKNSTRKRKKIKCSIESGKKCEKFSLFPFFFLHSGFGFHSLCFHFVFERGKHTLLLEIRAHKRELDMSDECECVCASALARSGSGSHSERETFVFDILCGFYGIWCSEEHLSFVIFVKLSKGSFHEQQHVIYTFFSSYFLVHTDAIVVVVAVRFVFLFFIFFRTIFVRFLTSLFDLSLP